MNSVIIKARLLTLGSAVAFLPFSIRFCHLSLLMLIIACLLEGNFSQRVKIIFENPLLWLLPALFFLYLLSVSYSENGTEAWRNVDKKIAFVLAPLIIGSASPFSKDEIRRIMWVFIGSCLLGTMVCVYDAIFVSNLSWNLGPEEPYRMLHPDASSQWTGISYIHLASGIGMHPTYFSFYLLVCILITLKMIDNRWLSSLLTIWFTVFIVFLSSRVVVFATLLTLVAFVSQKKMVLASIIMLVAAIVLNPIALYRNAQEYTTTNFTFPPAAMSDNPISIRVSLWWLSTRAFGEINPLIGTGAGDVESTISLLADKNEVHNVLNTSDPHNQYLHTYIALGIPGLLTLLGVFAFPLIVLFRRREWLACVGLVAFMAVCMTESALEVQKGIVLFSLFVSLTGNQFQEWRFTTQRLKYA